MTAFELGYGTNGFANHRLHEAVRLIAELGYTGIGLTLDHCHLDPFAPDVRDQVGRVRDVLDRHGLRVVVETGARYLLDPRHKHHPTLLCVDPAPRIDFLSRAVRIARELDADCVSMWSGAQPPDTDHELAWKRLLDGMAPVLDEAGRHGVRLAFEPEPGHLVARLADAERLRADLGRPESLGFTLDVGHCVAVEPVSAAECVHRAGRLLFNVQLDDMLPGVHEHLEFGSGHLDLAGTLAALDAAGYRGVAAVELPRHSHAAPEVAERSMDALRAALRHGRDHAAHAVREHGWLAWAERRVETDPSAVRSLFPAVGREVGREPVRADDPQGLVHGFVDDAARARLLGALAASVTPARLSSELLDLYRYGDAAERRGVLRALHQLPGTVLDAGRQLVEDALRTNDLRLVAAAMGPFAARELDQRTWRHGVLKCLFTGVPIAAVAALGERADRELVRMVADYAAEREAAGRPVPKDVEQILREEPDEDL